jgi:hypothetical protein
MTIIIGYFILAYIDYDVCRERLLSHHYLQITTRYFMPAYIDYDACREKLLSHHYLQITTRLPNKPNYSKLHLLVGGVIDYCASHN